MTNIDETLKQAIEKMKNSAANSVKKYKKIGSVPIGSFYEDFKLNDQEKTNKNANDQSKLNKEISNI